DVCSSDLDVALIVEGERIAVGAARPKGAEVSHHSVLPQEGAQRRARKAAFSDDLAGRVDRAGVALPSVEAAEVAEHALVPQERPSPSGRIVCLSEDLTLGIDRLGDEALERAEVGRDAV